MNLNKSYYRVKMTKDSLSLVEFIFISAIVTVHSGTVVLFETLCFVCWKTTLSCKMHFGVERYCFSFVLPRSKWPKQHHHFEDCILLCPAVRLLWQLLSGLITPQLITSLDKLTRQKPTPKLCPLYLKIYPIHFMCTVVLLVVLCCLNCISVVIMLLT